MSSIYDCLNRVFASFADTTNDAVFFDGLADYVDLVLSDMKTVSLLEEASEEKGKLESRLEGLKVEAYEKIVPIKEGLVSIVKGLKLPQDSVLDEAISDIAMLEDSRIQTSQPPANYIYNCLAKICYRLDELGFLDEIKGYYLLDDSGFKRFTFRHLLNEQDEFRKLLDDKTENSVWGALSNLILVRDLVRSGRENLIEMRKENRLLDELNYGGAWQEINKIRRGEEFNRIGPILFKRAKFQIYLNRVHNHLLTRLTANISPRDNMNLVYDRSHSTLVIGGSTISLSTTQAEVIEGYIQTADEGLETICYTEIAQAVGMEIEPQKANARYNQATVSINKKFKDEFNQDLFERNTKQLRLVDGAKISSS